MNVIQTLAEVGPDHMLHLQVPADFPVGPVEVLVVLESRRPEPTEEERLAAVKALRGSMKHLGISTEEFLAERREDDRRRDKALGL